MREESKPPWQGVEDGVWTRCAQPPALQDFRLMAFDMDATLVAAETVNELAELTGRADEVRALTQAAMQNPAVDFEHNLRQRMALFQGVSRATFAKVRDTRMPLTHGAADLVQACQRHGLRCVLISGGFTFFADALKARLALDEIHANVLEFDGERFTGRIHPQPGAAFVNAEGKRQRLLQVCARMGIAPQQAIAVGDGANDVPMLDAAGLAVAFHAHAALRDHADVAVDAGGLDRLLRWLA